MRGRRITEASSSCILFIRHKTTCSKYGNNSPTVECDCIKVVQFRDGSRRSTHEWKWPKAEDAAQRMLRERLGLVDIPAAKSEGSTVEDYTVERAVQEWIEEREQDGINNVKAVYLTKRLVAWCKRNDIRHLSEIQTQALAHWRTTEWKYAHGDSASMKIHWSVLGAFFEWCVERRLLAFNPRPKLKGKIKLKEVTPFTPEQIDLLLQTSLLMKNWNAERRLKMWTFIFLMQWSGMAIGDAACLERTKLAGLVIRGRRRKTDKRFSVPIPQRVVDSLRELPNNDHRYFFWHRRKDGSQVREDSIVQIYGGWFREVCDAAGIPEGHSHMLRHSFATYHLARNVRVERVAEWIGDDPAQVRKTYEHWLPQRDAQSLEAMQDSWAQIGLDKMGNPREPATPAVN